MKKSKFIVGGGLRRAVPLFPFVCSLLFTACPEPVTNNSAARTVTFLALDDYVTAPAVGEEPNAAPINTDQYSGSIAWQTASGQPADAAFAADTVYQAVLTLAAKGSYTFAGLAASAFTHSGAESVTLPQANANTGCTITIKFPPTGLITPVRLRALDDYITAPAVGAAPNAEPINTNQYRGSIEWKNAGGQPVNSAFAADTGYQAVLTLTAQGAYTFAGLEPDSFTHSLADSVLAAPADDGAGCAITITFETWYLAAITDASRIAASLEGKTSPVPLKLALALSSDNWQAILSALDTAGKDVSLNLSACTASGSTPNGGLNTNGTFAPNPSDSDSRRNNGKKKIQSLILPAGATAIAAGSSSAPSFQGFSSLQTLRGSGIKTIGEYAFSECSRLGNVSFPAAKSIGERAFSRCTSLGSASFPLAESIGDSAFYGCASLGNVSLPEAESIGERVFYGCASLGSVSLPEARFIGNYAFMDCAGLSSARLPAVEADSIGKQAFYNCASLETVELPLAQSISDGVFMNCARLGSVSLPAAESIGRFAFSGCTSLSSVSLPLAESIGIEAFSGCSKLNSISLPKAESIDNQTFSGCAGLNSVSLPLAKSIGNGAFAACVSLRNISLGAAEYIGPNAFKGCAGLESAALPSAESIGANAFEGCTRLGIVYPPEESIIPQGIVSFPLAKSIGSGAFKGCTSLESIRLLSAESIGANAFEDCTGLASVNLPAARSIGANAFEGCSRLASVDLMAARSIGNSAFKGCAGLASATLPAAESIGDNAFEGCSRLASVNLPAARSIGDSAFKGCAGLASASLAAAESIGANAFEGCSRLASVTLGAAPPAVGITLFGSISVSQPVTVKIPSSAKSDYGVPNLPGTNFDNELANGVYPDNWGNAFRGIGWDRTTGDYRGGAVNSHISLTFETY